MTSLPSTALLENFQSRQDRVEIKNDFNLKLKKKNKNKNEFETGQYEKRERKTLIGRLHRLTR